MPAVAVANWTSLQPKIMASDIRNVTADGRQGNPLGLVAVDRRDGDEQRDDRGQEDQDAQKRGGS